jgi:ankyrin repeat protein
VLEALLAAGAFVNATDDQGKTALIHAVGQDQDEAAKLLVEMGSDTHVRDRVGWKAIDWALALRKYQTVELLLEAAESCLPRPAWPNPAAVPTEPEAKLVRLACSDHH